MCLHALTRTHMYLHLLMYPLRSCGSIISVEVSRHAHALCYEGFLAGSHTFFPRKQLEFLSRAASGMRKTHTGIK